MIAFKFIVEDVDAENIFGILREQIDRNNLAIMDAIIAKDDNLIAAYKRDSVYVEELINTMKNSMERVPN